MFKTLKSKILAIAVAVFTAIVFVFMAYAFVFENMAKSLILMYYSRQIEVLKDGINEDIIKIENNSKDLALIGSLFYKTDKSVLLTEEVIKKIFENYPESLGGGIWFEPYLIDNSQKRFCFYAFRNKDGKIVIDKTFNSAEYDYLNQGWYKQIYSQIKEKKAAVAWSLPYYENQGSNTLMITAGSGIYDDKGNLIGISTVDWEINSIEDQIKNMNFVFKSRVIKSPFTSGEDIKHNFAVFVNSAADYIIISTDPYLDDKSIIGKSLVNIPWYNKNLINEIFITYHNNDYIPYVKNLDNGMSLIICIPRREMFHTLTLFLLVMIITLVLLDILIPALLYKSLNKYVMNPINVLIDIANKIGKGEDVKIKVEKPEEFAHLASTFDKMTSDIKSITTERQKINSELSIAKSIQTSSLPNVFPPFPEKTEFEIYASMQAAKEVGGDFYDFYFIDENNFMFLVADVSGKGVPAALFMMTVKTLINNLSQVGYSYKELIKIVNKKICETNKQGFFVTMLAGIINIKTGELSLINCGHDKPLIKRNNESYEYIDLDSNYPLGVFDDTEFSVYETFLNKGDVLFLYTDGIIEAADNAQNLYGDDRLLKMLNSIKEESDIEKINLAIKDDIKNYTESAPQSDDITMLIFKYNGSTSAKVFKQKAVIENYKSFYTWLHNNCEESGLEPDLVNKIDMCAEEIYANISFYAYAPNTGDIEVSFEKSGEDIVLEFKDTGMAYNPLERPDPDITLPPEQRPIGGLGVYMVKELAKEVVYKREENTNILTLKF